MSEFTTGLEVIKKKESDASLTMAVLLDLERIQARRGDSWLVNLQLTAPSAKNHEGKTVLSETLYMTGTLAEMLGFIRQELNKEAIITSYKLVEIGAHRVAEIEV